MTSAADARPRRRRWVGAMWAGVALVVAVPVVVVGGLWFVLQGGWDGVRPRAEATDRDVVAAREAAVEPQAVAAGDLQELAATALATEGADPLAAGDVDECFEGWTSWKVDDDYTLRCQVTTAVVLGLPERADLRSSAAALDDALGDAWTADGDVGLVDADQAFPSGRYVSTRSDDVVLVVTIDPSYPDGTSLGTGDSRRIWTDGSVDDVLLAGERHAGPVVELRLERTYFVDD